MRLLLLLAFLFAGYLKAETGPWPINKVWNYNLAKPSASADSVKGDDLVHLSSKGKASFLPSPPSGSTMISSLKGNPSFAFVGKGNTSGLKLSGLNANSSIAKFSAFEIEEASAVMSMSFTLKLDHPDEGKASWYFVIGKTAALFSDNKTTLPITSTGSSPNGSIFAAFRLQADPKFGVRFQARNQASLDETISWSNSNTSVFKKGIAYNIELYCNNTKSAQKYSRGGNSYDLPSRTYQIWVNGKQFGSDYAANGISVNKNLDAFMLAARDATMQGTTPDNSSSATIQNVKISYLGKN